MKKYIFGALVLVIGIIIVSVLMTKSGIENTVAGDTANDQKQKSLSFSEITSFELKNRLENKDFYLVDVHVPEQEHISNTDAFIPFDEIDARLNEFPEDKNAEIIVYCRSGSMSLVAAQTLIDHGYTRVSHLVGGINAFNKVK